MKNQKSNIKYQENIKKQKSNPKLVILIWLLVFSWLLMFGYWSFSHAMSSSSKADSGLSAKQEVYLGVFREGAPRNMNHIKKFVEQVGKKPATIIWYVDWQQSFPVTYAQNVIDYGAVPHIVWEAEYWSNSERVKINDIIAGKWDDYIRSWAKAIKAFNEPVFLRLGHEFNTQTYPWGVGRTGQDPAVFVKFYRRVVDIFKAEGVDNAKWVWCLNNYSNPDEAWNDWVDAYPGDKYVDWIGIDGYNWGSTQTWSGWETFKVLFRDQMRRAKKLWPTKPIMIAEFSSTEKGGDKATWIKELPGYLKSSMRDIDCLVWFDIKKEADWRIKSSNNSLAAFQTIIKDPIFKSSGPALAQHKVVAVAAEAKKKKVYALKAPGTVKIDGQLSDWKKSAPLVMKDSSFFKEGAAWSGVADLSGSAYIMWDETNFYLAAEITDSMPLINRQTRRDIWNGDALEVVMSTKPNADPKRTSFLSSDYQIGFGTGDGKNYQATIWNWQRRRTPTDSEIVVKKQGKGYVLEAMIPWEFFRGSFVPTSGTKVGFDIAFDDADATGQRERQFIWNGDFNFYKDPSVWGILEFK